MLKYSLVWSKLGVRDLFKRAKENSPCLILLMKLMPLVDKGAGIGGNDERQTLNQLLTEMDGFEEAVEL